MSKLGGGEINNYQQKVSKKEGLEAPDPHP